MVGEWRGENEVRMDPGRFRRGFYPERSDRLSRTRCSAGWCGGLMWRIDSTDRNYDWNKHSTWYYVRNNINKNDFSSQLLKIYKLSIIHASNINLSPIACLNDRFDHSPPWRTGSSPPCRESRRTTKLDDLTATLKKGWKIHQLQCATSVKNLGIRKAFGARLYENNRWLF